MIISTIKTRPITDKDNDLRKILDEYIKSPKEGSIVAVTSKIVAICEGRIKKISECDKKQLIIKETQHYLAPEDNKYDITLTIKNNLLMPSAGIDESNAFSHYILWPKNPQKSALEIWLFLKKKFKLKKLGVIITDSKTTPLRWGTTGVGIGYCGFSPLNNYIGKSDIFGRPFKVSKANVLDGLAAAAVLAMGEGAEQTPIAIIEDAHFVKFQQNPPTKNELQNLSIDIKDDIYAQILSATKWRKGGA